MNAGVAPDLLALPDGRHAHLWQGGASAGPVVFFQHGCPDSRLAACSGAAAARRAGVRLVAVNRPGYGLSDPHESGHVSVAADIASIADLLGIERFAVLGMSLGGPYALACAALYPDRVTAVGIVAGPADIPELDPPSHRDDLSDAQQSFFAGLAEMSVSEAVELLRPEFEGYVASMAPDDEDDDALASRYIGALAPHDAGLVAALPTAEVAAEIREALARTDGYLRDAAATFRNWQVSPERVRCPTWLWYGGQDVNASVRNGRWLADRIPEARLVVRTNATHLATLLEHWEDILTTLRDVTT